MKKNLLIEFNPLFNDVKVDNVTKENAETVETKNNIYPINECTKYIDTDNNRVLYLVNIDKPQQLQLSNIKDLSRSVALKNIFNFERTKKKVDIMAMMPYIIIVALILFK